MQPAENNTTGGQGSGLLTDLGTVGAVHPGEGPKARTRFGLHPLGSPGLLG